MLLTALTQFHECADFIPEPLNSTWRSSLRSLESEQYLNLSSRPLSLLQSTLPYFGFPPANTRLWNSGGHT